MRPQNDDTLVEVRVLMNAGLTYLSNIKNQFVRLRVRDLDVGVAAWNEDPEGVDGEVKQDEPSGHLLRVKRTLKNKMNYFRPNQEQLRSKLLSSWR